MAGDETETFVKSTSSHPKEMEVLLAAMRDVRIGGDVQIAEFSYRTADITLVDTIEAEPPKLVLLVNRLIATVASALAPTEGPNFATHAGAISEHSILLLEGSLASCLAGGGAHRDFEASLEVARDLARSAVDALLREGLSRYRLFRTSEPWCTFFHQAGWDETWIIVDTSTLIFTLLAATDND